MRPTLFAIVGRQIVDLQSVIAPLQTYRPAIYITFASYKIREMENINYLTMEAQKLNLFKQLDLLIREKKLYRNPSLNRSILAQHLRTNRTYISGCVRQSIGQTLSEYIDTLRISEFVDRLQSEGEQCLFVIAEEVGYSSYTTFYRSFIRHYGVSPAEYRQKLE